MMQKTGSSDSAAAVADYASRYTQDFASHYDAMVGWNARRASEGSFFGEILRRSRARTLLDVACGTGFHSVELSKAGFDVVAVYDKDAGWDQGRGSSGTEPGRSGK